MEKRDPRYGAYAAILEEELVPAMGCTEPIAVAYAAALARRTLGVLPRRVDAVVSANIIKNVKSVVVPHTGGLRGIPAAVAAGIAAGDPDRELEVLSAVTEEEIARIADYLAGADIRVAPAAGGLIFDIQITASAGEDRAFVRIAGNHTNVVRVERNGETLVDRPCAEGVRPAGTGHGCLTVEGIVEFAGAADIDDISRPLERQMEYNLASAREGLEGDWGAGIGKILLRAYGDTVWNRAKAWAAAGSDARMNGCERPVVINSGSGNQGITASVPVMVYAAEKGASREELLRALAVSNLVTIHLKDGIGPLSAYCGATSAGAGAGAGVCYLYGGRYREVAHTVVNALAINSGMICDGAKASCAAKIASAVEAGLLGWQMNRNDSEFVGGDGIVVKGVENTIAAVSRLARIGMAETDREIIHMMAPGRD